MAYLDPREATRDLRDGVVEGIKSHFPLQGRATSVHLEGVSVEEHKADPEDIEGQYRAKVNGRTWATPVVATLALKDNETGKVLERRRMKVADLPAMTKRYTYLVDGQEHQVDNQWQLKPGVYTRRRQSGVLEAQFNVPSRRSFDVTFDPEKKLFHMARGSSDKIPLYPLMKELGVDDDTLEKTWGREILNANRGASKGEHAVDKFFKADRHRAPKDRDEARAHFHESLKESKLRPESTEVTLGKAFHHVDGEVLTSATKKMLAVQGGAPEDERDSLVFKNLRTTGDYAKDKLSSWNVKKTVGLKVQRQINKPGAGLRDIIPTDLFNDQVKSTFRDNSLVREAGQVNPVEMMASSFQTSIMGPGGIQKEHAIMEEAKLISPSHLGFLDPMRTPEGSKTGVTLRLPMAVRKEGESPTIPVYNLRTNQMERINPKKFYDAKVVLPDQVRWQGGKPVPVGKTVQMSARGNEVRSDDFKSADYTLADPSQLFSMTSNLVPFMGNNSGNRVTYATQHIEQAISLKDREVPLVQVGTGKTGETFESFMGKNSAHRAPVSGVVTRVESGAVHIRDASGNSHKVGLYSNYPLNDQKSVLHSTPIVKVGEKVTAGSVVADNNFTQGGKLALGVNLRVGYVPLKGYNFEDGVVVSESAAKKMTSVHMHKPDVAVGDAITETQKYKIFHPTAFTKDQLSRVGDDGVVRVGARVLPGDPLVLATKPYELRNPGSIAQVRKSMTSQHTDGSLVWKSDYPGEVVGVHRDRAGKITVHVRTEEKLQVGDKIAGRHGNKGIVTAVLPDKEMPHTADGKHIEVALNPSGIPGRMNIGQVLETAVGKVVEKTGQPFVVHNFEHGVDQLERVKGLLKKHGLKDQEELFDPASGKSLGKVLVGPQHMLKLNFQIDKKVSARAGNVLEGGEPEHYDVNLIPSGGGKTGAQSIGNLGLYSLLAHGAKANIREMQTWKSEGEDPRGKWQSSHNQVWRAIQTGDYIPTPKKTFAFQKFEDMLRAAAINVDKKGHNIQLMPMTNAQVLAMSSGEVKDPSKVVMSKADKFGEPVPEKGGIFDPHLTGGHGGMKWTHMTLAEPMPNPVFEGAIQKVLGMPGRDYDMVVNGDKALDKKTGKLVELGAPNSIAGGAAIAHRLGQIDVPKELAAAKSQLDQMKVDGSIAHKESTTKLDHLYKKVRYLDALHSAGITAKDAYVIEHLPIIPPAMRPARFMPDGNLNEADLNGLYKQLGALNTKMRGAELVKKYGGDVAMKDARAGLYDGLGALMGVGQSWAERKKLDKGVLLQISGPNPKQGYFQGTLLKRRQDMTMRATITPEPAMGLDNVGLPEDKALVAFRPFVTQKLVHMGYARDALEAKSMLAKKGPKDKAVYKALDLVMEERPILLKRDPSLHKHSVQAFTAMRVPGKSIQIHPLVTSGYNADFNGDSVRGDTRMVVRIDGQVHAMTFDELMGVVKPGATEQDLLEEADGGTRILQVRGGLEVMSWLPSGGVSWRPVSEVTVHSSHGPAFTVSTHIGRRVVCSEHHNFGTVGQDLVWRKTKTDELKPGMLVPFVRHAPVGEELTEVVGPTGDALSLDFDAGWFFGYYAGDGSVTGRDDTVSLACGNDERHDFLAEKFKHVGLRPGDEPGRSVRATNRRWASHMKEAFGHGATNKKIPGFVFQSAYSFRMGFIAGLLDAESNIYVDSNGSGHVRMEVVSRTLLEDMAVLLSTVGIGSYLRDGKEPTDRTQRTYVMEVSRDDLDSLPSPRFADKAAVLSAILEAPRVVERSRYDLLPFSRELAELLMERSALRRLNPDRQKVNAYRSKEIRRYGDLGYVTRAAAYRIVDKYGRFDHPLYRRWLEYVDDVTTGWTLVSSVVETERPALMYDFSVPEGNETFAVAGGLITRNTMSVYVPVGHEAVKEAYGMMPSKNLFNEASGKVMYQPTNESSLGLYKLSRVTGDSGKAFKDPAELLRAAQSGKIEMTATAKIGDMRTTAGRIMLASALPDAMHKKILEDHSFVLDKRGTDHVYTELANKHKGDFGASAVKLMNLGYGAAFGVMKVQNPATAGTAFAVEKEGEHPKDHVQFLPFGAHSLGLDDFTPDKTVRDRAVAAAQKKIDKIQSNPSLSKSEKERRVVDTWFDATEKMVKEHTEKERKNPNNLFLMGQAGIKPGPDQYQQLRLAPMLVTDSQNRVIPRPITKSYAEGLDLGSYWTQMSGARRGTVLKVQEVRVPGYFTKRLVNTSMGLVVAGDDCGTHSGISIPVGSKDIYDRVLAKDVAVGGYTFAAGTHLTPDAVSTIRAADKGAQLLVRSPLKCEHEKGLCQKCAGIAPDGDYYKKGTNLGILATQSLGERATQLTLKAFHCLHEHSLLLVKQGDRVYHTTISKMADLGTRDTLVWDAGGWANVVGVSSHVQQPGTTMTFVRTRSGHSSVSQDNHPHMLRENFAVCPRCLTKPKKSNGGKQYYCRKCAHGWSGEPDDDAVTMMVQPRDISRNTHRANTSIGPEPTSEPEPISSGWLAGIYCAEGCVMVRQENGRPYAMGLYISQSLYSECYVRIGDELCDLLGKRGPRPRGHQVYSVEWANRFKEWFGLGSANKGLPDGWSGYSREWLLDFVSGVIDGDGTLQPCAHSAWTRVLIDTTSFLLAQQLHWILRRFGVRARVVLTPWRGSSLNQGMRVEFVLTEEAKSLLKASSKVYGVKAKPRQHDERFEDVVDYIKEFRFGSPPVVYDITTSTGTFYVDGLLTHNSGGVATRGPTMVNDIKRVIQLSELPGTIPNAAKLATKSGKVEKIEHDATGAKIWIGGVMHHVPKDTRGQPLWSAVPGERPTLPGTSTAWSPPKVGMAVQAGQVLSDPSRTDINPHDLYKATGRIEAVQNQMVNELHAIYGREGVRRQHVETVVKAMSNLTRVVDAGDSDRIVKGEYQPTSKISALNKELIKSGKKPVLHTPIIKGINVMPEMVQEDWMAKLNHNDLRSSLVESAAVGAVSNLHGLNPIPGMAYGAEFGMNRRHVLEKPHLRDVAEHAY